MPAQSPSPELLNRGATVYDGSGGAARRADLAVRDGAIVRIRPQAGSALAAPLVVDASGLALMPGIVDSHTHFDADEALLQGKPKR